MQKFIFPQHQSCRLYLSSLYAKLAMKQNTIKVIT